MQQALVKDVKGKTTAGESPLSCNSMPVISAGLQWAFLRNAMPTVDHVQRLHTV